MELHPNLEVRKAIQIAKDLGCTVQDKKRHGEIRFTHPDIETSFMISNNKKDIGKGFISWINPVLEERGLMTPKLIEGTKQWRLAITVCILHKYMNQSISNELIEFYSLDRSFKKKNVSDTLIHLHKKKILVKSGKGKYKPEQWITRYFNSTNIDESEYVKLEELLQYYPQKEEIRKEIEQFEQQSDFEEQITPEELKQSEQPELEESETEPTELQPMEESDVGKYDELFNRFANIIDRLEYACSKIEHAANRLEINEEMRDAIKILDDTLQKRRKTSD